MALNAKQIIAIGIGLGIATGLGYHYLTRPTPSVAADPAQELKPLASFDLQPVQLPKQTVSTPEILDVEPVMDEGNAKDDILIVQSTNEIETDNTTGSIDFDYPALEEPANELELDSQLSSEVVTDATLSDSAEVVPVVSLEGNHDDLELLADSSESFPTDNFPTATNETTPQAELVTEQSEPAKTRLATVETGKGNPVKHVWKANPFVGERATSPNSSSSDSKVESFLELGSPEAQLQQKPAQSEFEPGAPESDFATAEVVESLAAQLPGDTLNLASPSNVLQNSSDQTANTFEPLPMQSKEAIPVAKVRSQPNTRKVPLLAADAQKAVHSIEYGKELSRRGAGFSAREEFLKAVQVIAAANDRQKNSNEYTSALRLAMRIMNEAEDFVAASAEQQIQMELSEIVQAHQTRILEPEEASRMTPSQAIDRYFFEAQKQLDFAGGRSPVSAEVFYCLGKLHSVFANNKTVPTPLDTARSVVFHQAALASNPGHSGAANELGVLFAKNGRLEQSKVLFKRSLSIQPHPQTWKNLAAVHQRLGEHDMEARAENEYKLLVNQPLQTSSINWLEAEKFNSESQALVSERVAGLPMEKTPTTSQLKPPATERKPLSQRLKDLF